jgi:hypothetical protein
MADKDPADAPAADAPASDDGTVADDAVADAHADAVTNAATDATTGGDDGTNDGTDNGTDDGTGRPPALRRITSGALAAVTHGQRLTRSGWQNFRARPLYFQYRVALVAAWLVVSGLTIAVAPPVPRDFVVERRDLSFGLANRTALLVINQNSGNLDDCVLEVTGVDVDFDGHSLGPGTWRTKPFKFHKGDRKTISTEEFFDDKNRNPGYQLEVTRARLLDDDDVLWSGTPARPGTAQRAANTAPASRSP